MTLPSIPPWTPGKDPSQLILDALTRAMESRTNRDCYPLTAGCFIEGRPRHYTYRFTLGNDELDGIPNGSNLVLESQEGERFPVELVAQAPPEVTLIAGKPLPESVLRQAVLIRDQAYLVRHLKAGLEQSAGASRVDEVLFGVREPSPSPCSAFQVDEHIHALFHSVFFPDEVQERAIARSLQEELLLILGPPGTGKTNVLAAITLAHVLSPALPKVLVLSHTNLGVDNAVVRFLSFCQRLGLQELIENRRILRVGIPHLAELLTDVSRNVTLPLILDEAFADLRRQIDQHEDAYEQAYTQLAENRKNEASGARAWRKRRELLDKQLSEIRQQLVVAQAQAQQVRRARRQQIAGWKHQELDATALADQARGAVNAVVPQRRKAEQSVRMFSEQVAMWANSLQDLEAMPRLDRLCAWFGGKSRKRLQKAVDNAQESLYLARVHLRTARKEERRWCAALAEQTERKALASRQCTLVEQELEHIEKTVRARMQELEGQRAHIQEERQLGASQRSSLRTAIARQTRECQRLNTALAQLHQQYTEEQQALIRSLITSARVVGATLTSFCLSPVLREQPWDVVLLDEASMAPVPAVQLVARCAKQHMVLVGDPLQLAPVCAFHDESLKFWLGTDIFTLGGYTLEKARQDQQASILLPFQSRMHPEICDLIRGPVYRGLLRDRDPQAPKPCFAPCEQFPVVLCDTSGFSRTSRPTNGSSRQNVYHAELVVRLIEKILASAPHIQKEGIGVVTPYRAQVQLLQSVLGRKPFAPVVRVGTIHTFQGLEFDIVVFDTVEAPPLSLAPFLSGPWGSDAMRLINVAVTRARAKLVIVANVDHLLRAPAHYILPQVIRLARDKKLVSAALF